MDRTARWVRWQHDMDGAISPPAEAELSRAAARLRDLAAASVEMTEASTRNDVLQAATNWAREIVHAHQAVASLTVGDDWTQAIQALSLSERYGAWSDYDVPADGGGIYTLVCRENQPYRLTQAELEAHPAWRGFGCEADAHPPMRGWLAVPLVARDGRNLGLLQTSDKDAGADFDEQDELALVQLGRLASAAVERLDQLEESRAAAEELRRQHDLTATITENATSALFLMDAAGRPTFQNASARALFGFELHEISDRPLHEAIHHHRPDGSPYPISECPIDRALPEQRWVEPYEDLFLRKDGSFVPVAAAASPILRDGVPVGTVVEVRDLTEERRMRSARTAAEDRLRFVVEASEVLGRTFQYEWALQEVADRAVPTLADHCSVDLFDDGGLRRVASATRAPAGALVDLLTVPPPVEASDHPAAVAWRTGALAVATIRDGSWSNLGPGGLHRPWRREASITVLSVPISTSREVVGVLTLAHSDRLFDEGVLETAQDLARRAGGAIESARLFARVDFQRSLLEAQGEASVDGLVVVTPDGRIGWYNRRFLDLWRMPEEVVETGDRAALELAATRLVDAEGFLQRVDEIYAADMVAHDELRFLDGRTIERYGAPLHGSDQSRHGYFWSFRDITERKRVEQRLEGLYQRERELSHRLQAGLLETAPPPVSELSISSAYRPGSSGLEVGGDWFDSFAVPDGRVALVVGDVVGHGVDAAASMGQLRGALRALARTGTPGTILDGMSALLSDLGAGQLTTLAYVELEPSTGRLRYGCAGHPPPLVVSADGSTRFLWGGRTTPLGFRSRFRLQEAEDRLEPGDTLLLYTDGLVERRGEALDVGLERLARATSGFPLDTPDTAEAVCVRMLGPDAHDDDVCVLVAHRWDPSRFAHHLVAQPGELAPLRRRLQAWLERLQVTDRVRNEVVLALNEAVANGIEHGHGHDGSGMVGVEAVVEPDGTLRLTVRDDGRWKVPPTVTNRGRGITMMRALMDDVSVEGDEHGTTVVLVRRDAVGG